MLRLVAVAAFTLSLRTKRDIKVSVVVRATKILRLLLTSCTTNSIPYDILYIIQ